MTRRLQPDRVTKLLLTIRIKYQTHKLVAKLIIKMFKLY